MRGLGLSVVLGVVCGAGYAQVRVSAGEPGPTTALIWAQTRVPGVAVVELSRQPSFLPVERTIFQSAGNVTVPVKFEVTGLTPDSTYHYRVTNPTGARATGKFKTTPLPSDRRLIRFGVSGDGETSLLPFPALSNVPARDLNFFAYIGDTVYADFGGAAQTLPQYRQKHEGVLSSAFGRAYLPAARAANHWLVTLDDHEVVNDFSGGVVTGGLRYNKSPRYVEGMTAFFEYNPLRNTGWPSDIEERLFATRRVYRRYDWGANATFILTDNRSYRDGPFATGGGTAGFLNNSFQSGRTMMGESQLQRLIGDLRDAQSKGITWKFVAVSVPIMNLGVNSGARDKWDGYLFERTRLLRVIATENIDNVVFVSADIHGGLVNDLSYAESPTGPQIRTGAWDISTGPVAFSSTYGPNLHNTAVTGNWAGVVSTTTYDSYTDLQKELYIQNLLNQNRLGPVGYDPIGLQNSLVPATLLQGTYSATHHFTWSEFEVSEDGSQLTVTTWGVNRYSSSTDPSSFIDRAPFVIHRFRVQAVNSGPRP